MIDTLLEDPGARHSVRAFAEQEVAPLAARCDEESRIPPRLIRSLAEKGFLGAGLPSDWGGGMDALALGILHEEIGRASASVEGLLNVHNMASQALVRWGTRDQKRRWLPQLASGEKLAAFAITEPDVGSDAQAVRTTAAPVADGYLLKGRKRWISFGQIADVLVVLASCEGAPAAFLVERTSPGLSVEPIEGLLGCRGYMLAELSFRDCRVPASHLLGRPGLGFSHVASVGLDAGRYCLAWACVGLAQACLDACLDYARTRHQFGAPIGEFQLVQRMLADMIAGVRAARLVCQHAGALRERRDPAATLETCVAKYTASTTVTRIASDAVQIHGANGCGSEYPVQRYFRDSRIMELIEGSTQIQQTLIARSALRGPR